MKSRIALYSHDAQGMGHMRRNLAIAGALVASGRHLALLITGAHQAGALPLPRGVECVTLPALSKSNGGGYRARSLDVPLGGIIRLRAETVCAVLESYEPDVLIVDKHPLGIRRELEPAIELLRARGGTRLVLGMRDVLDDPAAVRAEWEADGVSPAIAANYDAVWVYGDPGLYDAVHEYELEPAVAEKVRYSGYLGPTTPSAAAGDPSHSLGLEEARIALCVVGGGQDGAALARAFARAPLPAATAGVVVAGPFMASRARDELHAAAARRADLRVLDFVEDPGPLLQRADLVVAMGGYNTVVELLALRKRALVVPRVRPRREQLIRAQRLAALGLLDVLEPARLSAGALGRWLAREAAPAPDARSVLDLDGLARLPALLDEVLMPAHDLQGANAVVA